MKVLIPVDETNRHTSVVEFVKRLRFPELTIQFLHAIPPIRSYDKSFMAVSALSAISREVDSLEVDEEKERLMVAMDEAKAQGIVASWQIGFGSPVSVIERTADEFEADLVAIAADPKGVTERLLTRSVSLELAEKYNGDLLVVRHKQTLSKELSMVYATNYSAGSQDCLDRLIGWNMKGVAHVEVLNAFKLVGHQSVSIGRRTAVCEQDVDLLMRDLMLEQAEATTKCFAIGDVAAHVTSLEMPIEKAVRETMFKTCSDLLVLNARVHGSWSNLMGESATVNEIKDDPYSLLILREK